jgi:hypothetical protein
MDHGEKKADLGTGGKEAQGAARDEKTVTSRSRRSRG